MSQPLQIRRGDKVRVRPSDKVYEVEYVGATHVRLLVRHSGAEWTANVSTASCELVSAVERLSGLAQ